MFQVFSSSRRDSGGGIYRAGSSSLGLLPYFDMADLASSGPYIVSKSLFLILYFRTLFKIYRGKTVLLSQCFFGTKICVICKVVSFLTREENIPLHY